jgi:hypothetical protein
MTMDCDCRQSPTRNCAEDFGTTGVFAGICTGVFQGAISGSHRRPSAIALHSGNRIGKKNQAARTRLI